MAWFPGRWFSRRWFPARWFGATTIVPVTPPFVRALAPAFAARRAGLSFAARSAVPTFSSRRLGEVTFDG